MHPAALVAVLLQTNSLWRTSSQDAQSACAGVCARCAFASLLTRCCPALLSHSGCVAAAACRYLHGLLVKEPQITNSNKARIVEVLRAIAELMIWGDQHNPQFFGQTRTQGQCTALPAGERPVPGPPHTRKQQKLTIPRSCSLLTLCVAVCMQISSRRRICCPTLCAF